MTRSFPPSSESIRVRVDDRGRPVAVTWRDREYVVETIEDRRELRVDWSAIGGEIRRTYFTLVAATPRLDIYRDEVTGDWFLALLDD